jgi:hypothetical protein
MIASTWIQFAIPLSHVTHIFALMAQLFQGKFLVNNSTTKVATAAAAAKPLPPSWKHCQFSHALYAREHGNLST